MVISSSDKSMNAKADMVNHPAHYISGSGLEVIDVIDAFTDGLTGFEAAYTANVLKYVCRWKHKGGVEDLKKAEWYLKRLIEKTAVATQAWIKDQSCTTSSSIDVSIKEEIKNGR